MPPQLALRRSLVVIQRRAAIGVGRSASARASQPVHLGTCDLGDGRAADRDRLSRRPGAGQCACAHSRLGNGQIDSENGSEIPAKKMRQALDMSRSGYHQWLEQPPPARSWDDRELRQLLNDIHAEWR